MVNVASRRHAGFFYALFLPAFVVVLFLTAYPIARVFSNSFFEYDYLAGTRTPLGLRNYVEVLAESGFRVAVGNTVRFTLIASAVEVAAGLVLALLFRGRFRGKPLMAVLLVVPMMFSTMVVCAIWSTLFHFEIGLLNSLLTRAGLDPVGWLISERLALYSLVIVDVWQWTPFCFVLLHAALSAIPQELFEASAIDGAGGLRTFAHVTLPSVSRHIVLAAMLRTIDTFRLFGKAYALTGGGPGNSTETVSYFVYREAFSYFNLGRAGAAGVITVGIIAVFAAVYIPHVLREGPR